MYPRYCWLYHGFSSCGFQLCRTSENSTRGQYCSPSSASLCIHWPTFHYHDVIMGAIGSHITSLAIVYSTIYWVADKKKLESPASLAFVRGIHRWPVNSKHKGPVTRKMFPLDDVIMHIWQRYKPSACTVLINNASHDYYIALADRGFNYVSSDHVALSKMGGVIPQNIAIFRVIM